jgi:hypothetical protein
MRHAVAPIAFALTLAALPPLLSAQSNPQRCQELQRELDQLSQSISQENADIEGKFLWAEITEAAMKEARANQLAASKPNLLETLLTDRATDAAAQREFRSKLKLAPALEAEIKAGRTYAFWNGALAELQHRLEGIDEDAERSSARVARTEERVYALKAEQRRDCASQPPVSPPAVERVRNIPVLTDPLITRWLRAWYAKEHGGGAYWQAGQLTQQDYLDIKDKVERWNIYCGSTDRRPEQDITDAECGVIRARQRDILNAQNGKWSEVNM